MSDPPPKREPLIHGRLIRRYKRFLVDVLLDDGSCVTAHCPNTGSMKNCLPSHADVWLSRSDNPHRKYALTWELLRTRRGHFIGVNTIRANSIVRDAITRGQVDELAGYSTVAAEKKYGQEKSRIDLYLSGHNSQVNCYVEIKSVTLLEVPVSRGRGFFPDSVSERGTRHLRELIQVVSQGYRGVLFYCVQHSGVQSVSPAKEIDPIYAETLAQAVAQGVEVLAYKVSFRGHKPRLAGRVPFVLSDSDHV